MEIQRLPPAHRRTSVNPSNSPAHKMNLGLNPYEPPRQTTSPTHSTGGFVCPDCNTSRPFLWLWLMQPFGHCSHCQIRLVVRRPGLHKAWTPILGCTFGVGSILAFYFFGSLGLPAAPVLLFACASADCAIAYRIGFLDRPRGII